MNKTPKLTEDIIDIVPFREFNLKAEIICIMTKSKSKRQVGYKKTEVNKYFILREVAESLGYMYNSISNMKNLSLDKNKYLLTRENIIKYRNGQNQVFYSRFMGFDTNYRFNFDINSIPTRGLLIIDIGGLCKLIMNSNKPEVRKFQDWVYSFVIPKAMEIGYYLDSDALYMDLYSKFSKIYYSYNVNPNYAPPSITLGSVNSYDSFMKDHNYFCILEDYQFQTRIYNIAYYLVFGRTYSSMFSNDPSIYTSKNNPYESAKELGGLVGIRSVDSVIRYVLNMLELGYTIDYLEEINMPNRNIINTRSVLSIPDGRLYKYIQSEKRYKDIDNIR